MDLNFSDSDDSAEDVVEAMPQTSGEQEPWAEGAIRELKQQPCSQGVHEDGDAWKLQRTHAASEADRLTKTQSSAYGRMEQQCGSMPYPPKPPMLPPFGMGQSQQMGPAADADSWAAWPTPQQLADQRSALIHHMPPPHPNAAMPLTRLSMVAAAPACGSMLSAISEPVVGHQGEPLPSSCRRRRMRGRACRGGLRPRQCRQRVSPARALVALAVLVCPSLVSRASRRRELRR